MLNTLLTFFLCLISLSVNAQNIKIDPVTNQVTNLNIKLEFQLSQTYDFDLQERTKPLRVNSIVVVNINEQGTGRLIVFVTDKVIFDIESCFKKGPNFELVIVNTMGRKIGASINMRGNTVSGFQLNNPENNTALILYYDRN